MQGDFPPATDFCGAKLHHSYSAFGLYCHQSNQNDQHGGQSIPNFDYAMAGGVKILPSRLQGQHGKGHRAAHRPGGGCQGLHRANDPGLERRNWVDPSLAQNATYKAAEHAYLLQHFDEGDRFPPPGNCGEICPFRETDRATYQAMEALVHNLNTMHSRAGAQIPF